MTSTIKLDTTQIIKLVIYGVLLWFLAIILVRSIGSMGGLDGVWRYVTYILVIPGTIPALLLARKLAKLGNSQMIVGVVIVTATALLLDGIAHAWLPSLYGTDPILIIKGAAAIFWGAGVGLILSLLMFR